MLLLALMAKPNNNVTDTNVLTKGCVRKVWLFCHLKWDWIYGIKGHYVYVSVPLSLSLTILLSKLPCPVDNLSMCRLLKSRSLQFGIRALDLSQWIHSNSNLKHILSINLFSVFSFPNTKSNYFFFHNCLRNAIHVG